MNNISYMKLTIVWLVFFLICCHCERTLVSRPIKSTYNQYGKITSLIIQWKGYQPIYSYDFLKLTVPEPIHDTSLLIQYSILTSHSINIISTGKSVTYAGSNTYYLPILTNLNPQVWYQLQIKLKKTLNFVYGLVQLQLVSRVAVPSIMHMWNDGFQYYHLEQDGIPNIGSLSLSINNSLSTKPADRYSVLIQISSSVLVNETVRVTIDFADFNVSTTPNITLQSAMSGAGKGFSFVGSCYTRCDFGDVYHACIHHQRCDVTPSSLTITLPYMKAGQIYLIQSYVINPSYVSSVGLQAYYQDNGGKTTSIAFANDLLQVLPITVQPQQIRLLWNIPYNIVANQMDLGLFVNDPAVNQQSLSTFDIGFSVSDFTPIQGQYQVKIYVGATSVLQSSINHNLPSLNTTSKLSCNYAKPNIICTGVDSFTLKNYRYYVRAKGYFTTADNIASFGNVDIVCLNQPGYLFVNLIRGLTVKKRTNSDYHDYGGLHQGTSNFRIGQTLVTSHNDTLLPNSTSNSIIDFLYSNFSIVGVDPSVSPQQLLFFLKVNLNQMSLPNPSTLGQNYTMKVFTNPNIMNTSNLGIQFTAYSSTTNNWDVSNSACYVDSSLTPTIQRYQCQKYNDHVYNTQIDNTFVKNNYYGLYKSICGSGAVALCPTADCSNSCRILRGGFASSGMVTGNAGILSIRNVTFIQNYQSPLQAGPMDFDFVIAFYQNGTYVSSSLINAYTFNRTRLQNVRADLINYYHDNTITNPGSRLPTLLKISGHLTLQEAGRKLIKSIRVHLPSPLTINDYVETNNLNNFGCSTNDCVGYLGGLTKVSDNWATQSSVTFNTIPSLTQKFTLLLPVLYSAPLQLLQVTISFVQFDGQIAGVFRINGSSVNQSLVGNLNYIALPWTPVTTWTTTAVQWVNQPSLFSYKQSIDLSQIYPFAPQGTINMGSTVMPIVDASPSTTFTSAYLNIFSNYSYPVIDTSIQCVNPFPYTYKNSYKIWTLWCPVTAGSGNQIKFNYPLYPESFGSNFPYSMIFSYAYSNSSGRMTGYRIQQNAGGVAKTCTTLRSTTYDRNSNNPQENEYMIYVSPFTLTPPSRTKFRINLSIPTQIPMSFISCRALESSLNINLDCTIITQASNVFKLELSYTGLLQMPVNTIRLYIKSIKSATSTITNVQMYNVTVQLPFTDSVTAKASFTGTVFTPFSSIVSNCSNSFTYSSVSPQQFIYLSNAKISAISANYYGNISFSATFSSSRSTFFDTSSLTITFSQAILTQFSRCQFSPNNHSFTWSSIDATNKIITLTPSRNIQDFTLTPYRITCSQIIPTANNVTISMLWKDTTYNIQTTFANVVASMVGINNSTINLAGVLVSKLYNTPAYLGEYLFNLSLPTTTNDRFMIYMDFPYSNIHENFVECEYFVGGVWTQVLCIVSLIRQRQQVYIQFVAGVSTNIQLKVYGIHQTKLGPSTIKILTIRQLITNNSLSYYITNIADTASTQITSKPIIVYNFTVFPNTTFTIDYSFPIIHSREFFVRFDQLFRLFTSITMKCMINDTIAVDCRRVRPDLLLVTTNVSHGVGFINKLTVNSVTYYYHEKFDVEEVHFSMFVTSINRDIVLYGSHQHLQNTLLTSSLLPPQTLIWKIPNNKYNSVVQIVYVGYYGPPADLIASTLRQLKQSFTFNYSNSIVFSIQDMAAQLGTDSQITHIGTFNNTSYGYKTLIFSHNSTYWSLSPLPIYVSPQKCSLKAEYNQYMIFSGGVTIPIFINISSCRPMDQMVIQTAINSPYITTDPTKSTKTVTFSTKAIYIVLSHQLTNATFGQSFQLKISLKSNNSIVQNAYNQIPNVTINIIDKGLLIGNPEAKQPIVNNITQSSINFGIQCNTPATIYWGVGIYPTMLGITVQEIQARLIDQNNGLVPSSYDIYSWSQEIYGLSYVNDFNIPKNISVDGLQGGLDYVFKYFCMDQTGTASGGKISQFTTPPSNYSLMKIILSYSNQLNYSQVNQIACSISQTLIVPYNYTISSVHSNCINNTQIYHKTAENYYDQYLVNSTSPYQYFFYVKTNKITTINITRTLVEKLTQDQVFMDGVVPYYSAMRVDSLKNDYEPMVNKLTTTVRRTSFTIQIDVGLANTYLIGALMGQHFNPVTMSLPTHYLMKQGFFSIGTRFEQIYSIYGRQNISITFNNLTQGSKFSVFYFLTVDNPALNSRHTEVKYIDFVTGKFLYIDLSSSNLSSFILGVLLASFMILWQ